MLSTQEVPGAETKVSEVRLKVSHPTRTLLHVIRHPEIQAPCLLHDAESMGPGAPPGTHTAMRQPDGPGRGDRALEWSPGSATALGRAALHP